VDAFGDGEPVDWVDMACPEAYKMEAFISVENRDIDAAFTALGKSIRLAPYWAEPLAERGYLLGQTGKLEEGLASYRAALALAETHESNRPLLALALRGIGYIQTELGALDDAEQAYRRSLETDPDSQVAKNELEYIRQQRARTQP
jgi:tetratricopeptide (TPR) repeat protein